jgi:hypothetical protein
MKGITKDLSIKLIDSVKMAVPYIHDRQTEDGGYFFARIPPGNLQDTFLCHLTSGSVKSYTGPDQS